MLDLPIEQRYRKENRMFHSSAFAIAAGVVGVAAAGAGAAVSISSSQQAARASGRAGARTKEELSRLQSQIAAVPVPRWNLARDIRDAERVTKYNVNQLEQIFPGAKTQREIASQATESYLRGEIPKDVQDQIMRSVAELGGAGFAPTTTQAGAGPSGFQSAQGLLSRQLGLTSLDMQTMGQNLARGWQSLAGAFIESPLQVGQARLGFEKAAADIELAKLGMIQEGAIQKYGMSMNTIGANLAANQAVASGIQSVGSAAAGGMMGVSGAYGQLAQAQGTGQFASPNKQGFYTSELAASRAFNVAPSQLSYQKGGGYYYQPGGQYGRGDIPRGIVYGR
jgi:hypothetical protein